MEAVERQFIHYPKQNKNAGNKPYRQTKNIYECIALMTKQITEWGFQVIL